jgi:uncharacterized RDD family membrane protein YckC
LSRRQNLDDGAGRLGGLIARPRRRTANDLACWPAVISRPAVVQTARGRCKKI